MAKSAIIIGDVFALIILLIAFSHSVGLINPIGQMMIKSQTYTTITHYQMLDAYRDMGISYQSKTAIPAGYQIDFYDQNYLLNSSVHNSAYLVASGSPNATKIRIGDFNASLTSTTSGHAAVKGPGWILIKSKPSGYQVLNYHEGSSTARMIDMAESKMPFQDTLVGLGKALSEVTTKLY